MLMGAKDSLGRGIIDYLFISTHSNELHRKCRDMMVGKYDYTAIADIDLEDSFSVDGVLVLKRNNVHGPHAVKLTRRSSFPG
jgi:hypothetical protein